MKYLFLSYLNRSGSTLLANILSRSPQICVCPEAEILYNLFLLRPDDKVSGKTIYNYRKILENDAKLQLWKISLEDLLDENKSNLFNFLSILERFKNNHFPEAEYILFKHNYLINLSQANFGENEIYYINLLRDPRSIFASQKNTISPATNKAMCNNAISFSDSWNDYLLKVNNTKTDNSALVYFEDLVEKTSSEIDKIFEFTGSASRWESIRENKPELSNWLSDEYRNIHQNIDFKPNPGVNDKWKGILTPKDLAIFSKHLNYPEKYKTEIVANSKMLMWIYEFYLRIERKFTFFRGKIQDKRLQHKLEK